MQYADVALGYNTNSGACVRSMYVPYYVGTPIDSPAMVLTDTGVQVDSDRVTVSFTRALDTGHHNITTAALGNVYDFTIMWASGPAPSNCQISPSYHGNDRGVRMVDWSNPSRVFPDFMQCQ